MKNGLKQLCKKIDILIVEDSLTQSMQLKYLLEKNMYSVITVDNGQNALEVLDQFEPTIIISDICMPEMDGLTATRIIKTFGKSLPIIATTAFALHSDGVKFYEAGCNEYLSKPIKRDNLFSMISKFIS
jgi:CheY-like chemotaxis protein